MPYDERSINELYESAEITPMGIQLEVNAEIFTTIYNLLSNMRSEEGIQQEDEKRLLHLWRKTVRAMAKVELRKGHGISMEKQIEMLKEAYAIETKYTADQLFSSVSSSKLIKEELEEVRRFSAEEMNTLFNSVIWPAMIKGKTGAQENPTAFIIAGQPGSGKTRMSSVIIDDYDGDIIQSMSDNFRGFHPRAKEVFQKYGRYCTYFSTKEGKYLSDLAMRKAAEEKYHNEKFHAITDTSPMADRWLAYQAGLGFFGRNHCLIHPKYGSYFTIGAILTTLALPPDTPLAMNCGSCTRCFAACPGKALSHERFNPWRCKSYLTQKKEVLNEEEKNILRKTPLIFGCDECQKCCPFNENAAYSPLPETGADRIPRLERETLEQISNRRFTKEYGEYAFSWRGRPVLLRNMDIIKKK